MAEVGALLVVIGADGESGGLSESSKLGAAFDASESVFTGGVLGLAPLVDSSKEL